MDCSSDEDQVDMELTPPEILNQAQIAQNRLLPPKSLERYMTTYDNFIAWKTQRKTKSFSENVLMAYFNEMSSKYKPSSMWSIYSMLKSTLKSKNDIDIKQYLKLTAFMKRQSDGFTSKKSNVLTSENVEKFLNEAPDDKFLLTKSPKSRKPFLRRTKATAPPESTDTETEPIVTETTTNKYTRRGNSKFKSRKEAALNAGRKEVPKKNEFENGTQRPSLSSVAARSERPTRNFVRRRLGGVNATTPLPAQASPSSTTASPTSRRPFRIASRRRPSQGTSTTSTTPAPTAGLVSEESLQDIGDTDSIEDPALVPRGVPKTVKIQRRPLVSLKEEAKDQNPSATNEEERKRQSKKYSSSINRNQLDELKKPKSQEETTTTGSTTAEDYSAETAVAIAAHQLLAAPLPNIPDYEEPQPAKKSTQQTTSEYSYTSPQYTDFTDSRTIYSEDFSSTPNYEFSSLRTRDDIPTSTGGYESTSYVPKSTYTPKTTYSTPGVYLTTLSRAPVSTPSVLSQGASGAQNLGPSTARYVGDKYAVPVDEYAYSTGGYTAQEPSYFTREYLLESPVTKTYDDEYQYLSPITTPQTRKPTRKTVQRRISTTLPPTAAPTPATTPKPRRVPDRQRPFDKIPKLPNRTYRPIDNYDYYDDGEERVAEKYEKGTKVVLHGKGTIECFDIGNFPHPSSCKKFISCARIDNGSFLGWEYICPKGLSFDPVGGICNWSAGLGCDEKDL